MKENLTHRNPQSRLSEAMAETTLGKELLRLRGDRSLRTVAADIGISHSLLALIEKGEVELPRRDTMDALAGYYGVPVEYLARLAYCGGRRPAALVPLTA